ncbi:MAG: DNA polymerase I [Tissierellia bacterium]|nr:DNA polymerase I [Tissierellia bacterium]
MGNDIFLIIDGNSLIFRAFYALPLLKNSKGLYTNAVYGFLNMFFKIRDEISPKYIAVVFDEKGKTIRHKDYEDYKANRKETPSELSIQFPMLKEILDLLGIYHIGIEGYEADDIAGTLSLEADKIEVDSILLTADRDYLQLVSDNTKVVLTKKGITNTKTYDRDAIIEDFGIEPEKLVELKGLMGDPSDNIPGVKGVGEKTGLKLIKEFGTIENLYNNISQVSGKKLKENLENEKKQAFLSRKLGEIILNVPMDINFDYYLPGEVQVDELIKFFEELEFRSFEKYITGTKNKKADKIFDYKLVKNIDELISELSSVDSFSFKIFTYTDDYLLNEICAIAFSKGEEENLIFYCEDLLALKDLNILFENNKIKKYGHNLKSDIVILKSLDIDIKGLDFDVEIASYLLNPSSTKFDLNILAQDELDIKIESFEDLLGKGKSKKKLSEISKEKLSRFIAAYVETIYKLTNIMKETIKKNNLDKLYKDIEMPLIKVLANMEYLGFKIDTTELGNLGNGFNKELAELTQDIYDLAGQEFNINSPKQLGEILFEKLNLPIIKKTKTGYSTDVDVLTTLEDKHEIIGKILRYRQIMKLNSTYVEGFLKLVNTKTNRIHSRFNQTVAQTGRISSENPNLQNIPIRTAEGRLIRKAFIAKNKNFKLVDADYSQIELRILAHISNDENMIAAFNDGIDIHTKTASEVFNVSIDEVTTEMRSRAKAVNFGIIYGISDYGLSRDLNISRAEAKEYIEGYLDNFPNVKKYMDDTIKYAKDNGYVETLLGRIRYIDEIKAKNYNIRSFGERIALNTPIQGTAADIIKLAMVKVYEELKNNNLKSELILQIHDELIIESPLEEVEEVKDIMKSVMENVISLRVPLIVDIDVGDNWYETD